jgi:hypothetical protein
VDTDRCVQLRPDLGEAPDIEIHFVAATAGLRDHLNLNFKEEDFPALNGRTTFAALPTLLHPRSTGTVRLQSGTWGLLSCGHKGWANALQPIRTSHR